MIKYHTRHPSLSDPNFVIKVSTGVLSHGQVDYIRNHPKVRNFDTNMDHTVGGELAMRLVYQPKHNEDVIIEVKMYGVSFSSIMEYLYSEEMCNCQACREHLVVAVLHGFNPQKWLSENILNTIPG